MGRLPAERKAMKQVWQHLTAMPVLGWGELRQRDKGRGQHSGGARPMFKIVKQTDK